jgi:hypothetical protein
LRSTLRSWLYLHLKPLVHWPCLKNSHTTDLGSTPVRVVCAGVGGCRWGGSSKGGAGSECQSGLYKNMQQETNRRVQAAHHTPSTPIAAKPAAVLLAW